MKLVKLGKDTKSPVKAHLPDTGLDIFIPETFEIEAFETKTVGLNLKVAIPEGFAGMLVPRSSIAEKGLIIQTSIIDPDYTGEIHLIVTNCSTKHQTIQKDSRLCSLVVYSVLNPYLQFVDELPNTERGEKGLGSSGI